jgi:hypothetical protein
MNPFVTKFTAIAFSGIMAISSFAPAQAQDNSLNAEQRKQVVQAYCQKYPSDADCSGWWFWSARDYDAFYNRNRNNLEPLIAGLFGLAIGAIIAGAIANSNKSAPAPRPSAGGNFDAGHVARCAARYKSYDHRTDTFLGNDGYRHPCNL